MWNSLRNGWWWNQEWEFDGVIDLEWLVMFMAPRTDWTRFDSWGWLNFGSYVELQWSFDRFSVSVWPTKKVDLTDLTWFKLSVSMGMEQRLDASSSHILLTSWHMEVANHPQTSTDNLETGQSMKGVSSPMALGLMKKLGGWWKITPFSSHGWMRTIPTSSSTCAASKSEFCQRFALSRRSWDRLIGWMDFRSNNWDVQVLPCFEKTAGCTRIAPIGRYIPQPFRMNYIILWYG